MGWRMKAPFNPLPCLVQVDILQVLGGVVPFVRDLEEQPTNSTSLPADCRKFD